jgi:hypothetical protein
MDFEKYCVLLPSAASKSVFFFLESQKKLKFSIFLQNRNIHKITASSAQKHATQFF